MVNKAKYFLRRGGESETTAKSGAQILHTLEAGLKDPRKTATGQGTTREELNGKDTFF